MYQLFFNGYPIYDPRDPELLIRNPDIHLAVGESGSASFTIDSDHPYADKLTRIKGVLELMSDGLRIYKGRIRKDIQGLNLSRDITTEGLLACLNDSIIPPFNFPDDFADDAEYVAAAESGNVVQFFLSWLLNQHNSQVGPDQQIHLGDVTVTDPNNYISRSSSDYNTTMDIVRNKLEKLMGGYLLADYSGDTTVLHYYADLPLTNTQSVEYGENLLDLVSELDSADTYTAILPLGKDSLTIADLPDGELSPGIVKEGRIIYSEDAENSCGGRITRAVKWDDVTLASNLQTKAVAELTKKGVMTTQTIEATAADLGASDADVARFVVGRYVRLLSSPHGFSATFPLMELTPDIFDPGNTKITMGATTLTASDISHGNQSSTQEALDKQQMQMDQTKESLDQLAETTRAQITEAIQTSKEIILSALDSYVETSNFEEYKETVVSQLSILAGQIEMRFTQTTEQIKDVNGDLQAKYNKISKYFRFTETGMIIGMDGNELCLNLDYNIVQFLRSSLPQLWMDERGVHCDEIHVGAIYLGPAAAITTDANGVVTGRSVTE